ncbi:hypothetical protein SAMN05421820_10424 [Pedobacter steynii]|uniref:Uncharacterized protein n=1 Tax=Pedobacter steynii TaxID=430522 RepID=A0A1G9U0T6_9SPHI|nr:hypothetical protein [Pedobacter steynii]NQX40621.1 hypothetical protein [Pedobacter steynii]SDM53556.1 hypothetical protein SAMN05421820_10424 [Pedobacter steynii]
MKRYLVLALLVAGHYSAAFCQDENLKKETLKKKYENSDIGQEIDKKMRSDVQYPDSIVLAPLHFINTYIPLDKAGFDFTSISLDVVVKTKIPKGYNFYISPFNGTFNEIQFYAGIQTSSDGIPAKGGKERKIGRGGIFSRWMERDTAALKATGYYASSDGEGDFISVRNKVKWDQGTYRLTLYKSGEVDGKPVPPDYKGKDLIFAWGEYEHSWVTMSVEDLKTGKKYIIGSMAFPGKKLLFGNYNAIFLEQYGSVINFAKEKPKATPLAVNYKDLPVVKLEIKNLMLNGKLVIPKAVITNPNLTHHPEQSKIAMPIPILSKDAYDPKTGTISYEVGEFQRWK